MRKSVDIHVMVRSNIPKDGCSDLELMQGRDLLVHFPPHEGHVLDAYSVEALLALLFAPTFCIMFGTIQYPRGRLRVARGGAAASQRR